MKILMVCLGNICRSPMAEGILRAKMLREGLKGEVDSAGTESYHIGETPHPLAQKIASAHGVDISGHRARKFGKADFDRFDRIYAMAGDVYREIKRIGGPEGKMEKVDLFLNELYPGENFSVPDPWYGGAEEFQEVFDLIDQCCEKILEKQPAANQSALP